MSKKKGWWFKGQSRKVGEDKGGKCITLLVATSIFGVELIMVIEGSVNTLIWCYFITEV